MGTFQRPNRLFFLAIIGLSTILAACSSGGGSSGKAANDTRPDPFALSAPSDIDLDEVAFDTPIVSDPVTIKGIDTAAPVSIEGGEYAIGDGEFTNAPGTVRNGQNVRVRVQSPVKAEQTATATLNIGGVTESFTVTTGPDTVPPEVAILFPPPASMTEGATLFMRGTVKDANGTLGDGAVTVNGVEAELALNEAGDEGTWSVEVALAPGDNAITVTAADVAENASDGESVSSRRVGSIAEESFPNNEEPFFSVFKADAGLFKGQPTAFITDDSRERPGIVAVDLTTGVRTLVADNQGVEEDLRFGEPQSIHFGTNGKLYVSDYSSVIYEIDLDKDSRRKIAEAGDGSYSTNPLGMFLQEKSLYVADRQRLYSVNIDSLEQALISGANEMIPDNQDPFDDLWGLTFVDGQIFVTDYTGRIFSVDSISGKRTILSELELMSAAVVDLLIEPKVGEFLYLNRSSSHMGVFKFDIKSKESEILSGPQNPNDINSPREVWGIAAHYLEGYLLLVDRGRNAIYAVDLIFGHRVVISKSAS